MSQVKFSNITWEDIIYKRSVSRSSQFKFTSTFSLFGGPPITRDDILQAAENQVLLEEVLEAERTCINERFELFQILIACILLLFITANRTPRTHNLGTSNHRKSVIDHVTIRSGDIEKNPGPCALKLNDWLKSMLLFIVDLINGYEGKRISWKKLGLPDPNNSKFDHSKLVVLFRDQLLQHAEARIPAESDNYEEFQLLKAYVKSGQKPDLCRIQELMSIRTQTVTWLKVIREFWSQSQAVQQGVINNVAKRGLQLPLLYHQQETTDGDETGEVARDGDVEGGVDSQSNDLSGTGSVNQTDNGSQSNHCGGLARHESSVDEKEVDEKSHNPGKERGISDQPKCPHQEEMILPESSEEAARDPTEHWDWLYQLIDSDFELDATVEGVTETHAVGQSGRHDTDDPLQQELDQHGSRNSDKAFNDTIQAAHSSTQNTIMTADTPDPCQGDTAGTSTFSQDQQSSATAPSDQHTQLGYVIMNLKLFTGMEELDKRVYDVNEIEKLSRKRKWRQSEDSEIVKKAKSQ